MCDWRQNKDTLCVVLNAWCMSLSFANVVNVDQEIWF